MYSLNKIYSGNGSITYDLNNDHIVINYLSTENFVHECTHAGQYESGEIAFSKKGTSLGQDVYDKIGAYKAQYGYSPSSVSGLNSNSSVNSFEDITTSWVQNLTDFTGEKIYLPGTSTNTGLYPVNINTGYDGLVKAYPQLDGKIPTNTRIKNIAKKYKSK